MKQKGNAETGKEPSMSWSCELAIEWVACYVVGLAEGIDQALRQRVRPPTASLT